MHTSNSMSEILKPLKLQDIIFQTSETRLVPVVRFHWCIFWRGKPRTYLSKDLFNNELCGDPEHVFRPYRCV